VAQRVLRRFFGFSREAGDKVGAEGHIRARRTQARAQILRLRGEMAALHPLQDHVVARLQ